MKNLKTIILPRISEAVLLQINKRHRIAKNRKKQEQIKACKNFKNKKNDLLKEMEERENVGF